jgi:MerR family transcriptional regulator, light-induced transcriptional regulator
LHNKFIGSTLLHVYRIQAVAQRAGITTQLVRAWERRYGLVKPQRTDAKYRVYSDDDVAILKGAKLLVDEGLRIAEVARLPRERLRRASLRLSGGEASTDMPTPSSFLELALDAIAALDGETIEKLLFRASGMGVRPAGEICEKVLLPLLRAIGDRWEKKRLSVAAEHFGSAIVRARLQGLLASEVRRIPNARKVVCACPEGELHEGGLLAFAVHAAGAGLDIIYLGANTPIEETLATAEATQARAIALSITRPLAKSLRTKMISRLAAWKDGGMDRRVLLGGYGAERERERFREAGLIIVEQATNVALPWGNSDWV